MHAFKQPSSLLPQVKTLDEYLAERQGASSSALDRAGSSASGASVPTPPAANAWATKSRASSASSLATDPVAQVRLGKRMQRSAQLAPRAREACMLQNTQLRGSRGLHPGFQDCCSLTRTPHCCVASG